MPFAVNPADAISLDRRKAAFHDLCEAYDVLLRPEAGPIPPGARGDLETFARLLDLNIDEAAAEGDIWRQVRPVLARQVMEEGDVGPQDGEADTGGGKVFMPADAGQGDDQAFSDPPASLSLLVVEDDPDLLAGLVETLSEAGHRVVAAVASAEDAASVAALHAFDFAIVDVELAGAGDGVDLARRLHADWGTPVLFVSGSANEDLVRMEFALGFLGKPFNAQELLASVTLAAGLLRRRRG